MPLTKKGKKIKRSLFGSYGKKTGERVFYAMRNSGQISGVDRRRRRSGSSFEGEVEYDPFGRQVATYEVDPDGTVVEYDPFGRLVSTYEEEDSVLNPVFAVIGDVRVEPPTKVQLYDAIEIDDAAKVSFTEDGFLKAMPRIARTGVQVYGGDECGIDFADVVKVYRPPSAVFDSKAIHSYTHLPTTLEHPDRPVTTDNWKEHATGETGDEVLRDGGTVRVPMMLRDSKAIAAWKDGTKKQLSVGYTCDLVWAPGVVPHGEIHAGEAYDAIQTNIRANHLAQCAAARGGPILSIGDSTKENGMNAPVLKTVMVDGIQCEMTDTAAQLVQKTIATYQAKIDAFKKKDEDDDEEMEDAKKQISALGDTIKAKDAEIVTLKKAVEDARLKPEQIDAMVRDRADVFSKAKLVLGDSYKFEGKTVEDARRAVVSAHLGDVAKSWDDNQVRASFDSIIAMLPKNQTQRGTIDHAVYVFAGRPGYVEQTNPQAIRDAAYADSVRELNDAWKPQAVRDAEAAARRAAGSY
jgi:hypothetical protein